MPIPNYFQYLFDIEIIFTEKVYSNNNPYNYANDISNIICIFFALITDSIGIIGAHGPMLCPMRVCFVRRLRPFHVCHRRTARTIDQKTLTGMLNKYA
uniref:Uncharacterized protein n=1 Tax=Rhizobium rhizogenes TaxID=359 RepID=A0A7S4ZRH4_RHIRH|nr:hypothetical protein pC5.7b_414 [Rhizobium rhizogenes]